MINNEVLLANIKDLKEDITDMKTKLFGNGQTGLLDRVNTLETIHTEAWKYERRWKYIFTTALFTIGVIIALLQLF